MSEFAERDLIPLSREDRLEIVRVLETLSDDDLHSSCERLRGWDRGPNGAWIFLRPSQCRWAFLCQLDRNAPELWHMGLGRGMLQVDGVKSALYAEQLLLRIAVAEEQ